MLLAVQDRASSGTFATNRYLLFPSDEDVARYAGEESDPEARMPLDVPPTATPRPAHPSVEKPSTVPPHTAAPFTEKAHERRTMGNKNHGEQEPVRERAPHVTPAPLREQDAASSSTEHPAIAAYRATFGRSPTERQTAAIVQTVTDITRWTRVLDDWLTNAWRVESVGKMLDRYHSHDQERTYAAQSGRIGHADGRPARPSAAPTPEELARFLNRPRRDGSRPAA